MFIPFPLVGQLCVFKTWATAVAVQPVGSLTLFVFGHSSLNGLLWHHLALHKGDMEARASDVSVGSVPAWFVAYESWRPYSSIHCFNAGGMFVLSKFPESAYPSTWGNRSSALTNTKPLSPGRFMTYATLSPSKVATWSAFNWARVLLIENFSGRFFMALLNESCLASMHCHEAADKIARLKNVL